MNPLINKKNKNFSDRMGKKREQEERERKNKSEWKIKNDKKENEVESSIY